MKKKLISVWVIAIVMLLWTGCMSKPMAAAPVVAVALTTPTPKPTKSAATPTPTLTPTPVLTAPVGQSGAWQLRFAADFDGSGLNGEKWVTCYWWDDQGCTIASNHELQWYRRENVTVGDGMVRLQARREAVQAPDGRDFSYTSGLISSGRRVADLTVPPKFAFQYGYVEMRAKVPRGQGLWSAFWLLPADQQSRPEIDVMEILGHAPGTVEMHLHYDDATGKKQRQGNEWTGPDLSTDWHVFAVDWQPERLIWYVDGVERWRVSDKAAIPAEPMYLIANLAVGGDCPGAPDAQTPFPSTLLIDYIRVWQR